MKPRECWMGLNELSCRVSSESIILKNPGAWFHRGLGSGDEGAGLLLL